MTGKSEIKKRKEAYVTLEFAVGLVVIAVPLLLGITEVYRVEHTVRKMLFSGQQECLDAAVRGSGGVSYRVLSIPLSDDVELLTFTKRYFGGKWNPTKEHFARTYYIGTGTGRE